MSKTALEIGEIAGAIALMVVTYGAAASLAVAWGISAATSSTLFAVGMAAGISGVFGLLQPLLNPQDTSVPGSQSNASESAAFRRVIYGVFEASGVLTFDEMPAGNGPFQNPPDADGNYVGMSNWRHQVYTVSGTEITSFGRGGVPMVVIDDILTELELDPGGSGYYIPVDAMNPYAGIGPSSVFGIGVSGLTWHIGFEFDTGDPSANSAFPLLSQACPDWGGSESTQPIFLGTISRANGVVTFTAVGYAIAPSVGYGIYVRCQNDPTFNGGPFTIATQVFDGYSKWTLTWAQGGLDSAPGTAQISEAPIVTLSNPIQKGRAKVHVAMRSDVNANGSVPNGNLWTSAPIYQSGRVPTFRFPLTGKPILDTRIPPTPMKWLASSGFGFFVAIVDSNGNVQVQTVGPRYPPPLSGATVPEWSTAPEGETPDNQCNWINYGPLHSAWPGPNVVINNPDPPYAFTDPNGNVQICLYADFETGAAQPDWSTQAATETGDGTPYNADAWVCAIPSPGGGYGVAANPSNPALVIMDWLTNAEYGENAALSTIDIDSINAAANICEEMVTVYVTSTAKSGSSQYQDDFDSTSSWVSTQCRSTGSILYTPTSIKPYFSNLAAMGMTRDPARYAEVLAWIQWYFAHWNWPDQWGLYGTIYDYSVTDGVESITEPANCDSTDAYAATFISLIWAAWQTGDAATRAYIATLDYNLDVLGGVLIQTQQPDGLTWAKPDYQIKYLEDNCEVYRGFSDLVSLFTYAVPDATKAAYYAAAAAASLSGLMSMYVGGQWSVYKDGVGVLHAPVMSTFYPDAQSQMFPALCGVVAPASSQAVDAYAAFNAAWPGWPELSFVTEGDPFPQCLLGQAAAVMGDSTRLATYISSVQAAYIPGFAWPFYCAEAGWFLRANEYMIGLDIVPALAVQEQRYQCNGLFDQGATRGDVLKSLLSSMAGIILPPGDMWHLFAGAYNPPSFTLTDADLRGPIKGDFRISRRDIANGVKGTFIPSFLPTNQTEQQPVAWRWTDFPPYQGGGQQGHPNYIAEDGGEIIWKDMRLGFTTSIWMAQRLAKITLQMLRFQVSLHLACKLTAFPIQTGDTITFIHRRWAGLAVPPPTIFFVTHSTLIAETSGGALAWGIDLVLRETDPSVYEFDAPTLYQAPGSAWVEGDGEYSQYGTLGTY